MARSFKQAMEKMEEQTSAPEGFQVPEGYTLKRESISKRTSIIMRPTYYEKVKALALKRGISKNQMFVQIIEEYIDNHNE